MATIQSIRGTKDIIPPHINSWQQLESIARNVSKRYGYKEIRTPIFEKTEVFSRGVGDGTDIVNKEMYTFFDRGNESLTLRPEQTAALVRAVIQNNLLGDNVATRLYYLGSYYRYERPQKGRLREFHQYGIECLNSKYPESDAEVIMLAINFINELGINEYKLNLNSLGNEISRSNYKKSLVSFLNEHSNNLSEDSKYRLDINPLRILDSKSLDDIEVLKNAPSILEYLDSESSDHFEKVKELLTISNIDFEIQSNLVRGLDYYSHTVFEFQSTFLGSQDAFGGGGRYNSLFNELGGKDTPSVGFAMGIERLLLILEQIGNANLSNQNEIDFAIIPTNEYHIAYATKIANTLRKKLKQNAIIDVNRRSIKSQLREANRINAKYVLLIGDEEVANNQVTIKFMQEQKEQVSVNIDLLHKFI